MTAELSREDWLARDGALLITRAPRPLVGLVPSAPQGNRPDMLDIFIAITAEGGVFGFNGHVDLGTGIRTALAQIVAEELDVGVERVTIVLGDTARAPDQGPTIASETIQMTAAPLRQAAAQARLVLLRAAAERLGVAEAELSVADGVISAGAVTISYGDLLRGRTLHVTLDETVSVKQRADYRIVGHPVPRSDIPAKAVGSFSFVHDVRVPGMLHGRVIRPPYLGHDSGVFVGRSLESVDQSSIAHVPGIVAVVSQGDFVGVVAEREEQAEAAMRALRVTWKPATPGLDLSDVPTALRRQPATRRVLLEKGDVTQALAGAATRLRRSYSWPYQMHGSIGPSCAVADHAPGRLVVWSGTQNPHLLARDLALLLGMAGHEVEVNRMEAAGCYGRNCADDVTGDAALLSRATGRPVRVQLTREQEHAWEPKGAAQICDVDGGIDAAGDLVGYDFLTRYPSNLAPMLPLLLTGVVAPVADVVPMGDRTAVPPYEYPAMRIACDDLAPLVRASWFRGVSALPNSFAHECFIDELAMEAGVDPVEYRLRHLADPRAADLVRAVAKRANWQSHTGPRQRADGDILTGQGFAYAVYVHGPFPGHAAALAAWVAEVEVNRRTGEVVITRVTVGQDQGLMINPDGVRHQVHGNVIQSASRALKEQVAFDAGGPVASREWGAYPAFPYTSFSGMTDDDLLALYAHLMTQAPVQAPVAETRLAFPFNLRPLMAGWNLLFHRSGALAPEPTQSARWNRGRYLVEAVGHCGACHTPRNALGAERGSQFLNGAMVGGWEAPALTELSRAPVPWTEQALFDYLSTGHAADHGAAAGPMGEVVAQLAALPASDIAEVAHYVASLSPPRPQVVADALVNASWKSLDTATGSAARLFDGACRACHHDGSGPAVFGQNIPLALNSNLHSARPDNLLRILLDGIASPARPGLGPMPGFRDSLNDQQLASLAGFLRARLAPQEPAWTDVEATLARLRRRSL